MNKTYAVYFSATGTTKTVVEAIAGVLASELDAQLEIIDFTLPKEREHMLEFDADDIVVFGVPTYAGRVPNVLLPFLKEKLSGGGALAVPVVLFGNRDFDDSLIELRDLLESAGFHTIAGAAFVGEHSFSRILGAGRPDADDLARVSEFATAVAGKVQGLDAPLDSPCHVRGEVPIRPYYTPRDRNGTPINILKVKPKVNADCIRCGLCARVCPMGSIDFDDIEQFTGICIKCCACEKKCPKHARYFDDVGYLYHKTELEEIYARRANPEIFI